MRYFEAAGDLEKCATELSALASQCHSVGLEKLAEALETRATLVRENAERIGERAIVSSLLPASKTIEITDEACAKLDDIKASMVESATPSDVILYLAEVYQEVADHRLLPWMV